MGNGSEPPRSHKSSRRCELIRDDSSALPRLRKMRVFYDDSWAHAHKHEDAAVPHFKALMPPAREDLTQYSTVRWESGEHTMGERAKLGTPWW